MFFWKSLAFSKRPWSWERLRAGGEVGHRAWDGWIASVTQWTWKLQTPGDSEGQGSLAFAVHSVSKSWTPLSDWTKTITIFRNSKSNDRWLKFNEHFQVPAILLRVSTVSISSVITSMKRWGKHLSRWRKRWGKPLHFSAFTFYFDRAQCDMTSLYSCFIYTETDEDKKTKKKRQCPGVN